MVKLSQPRNDLTGKRYSVLASITFLPTFKDMASLKSDVPGQDICNDFYPNVSEFHCSDQGHWEEMAAAAIAWAIIYTSVLA